MELRHIVVAVDASAAGRAAVGAAACLGRKSGARITALAVTEPHVGVGPADPYGGELAQWIGELTQSVPGAPRFELATAWGLPGVEIGRFAETNSADLIVIGHKRRPPHQRRLIGDTADAVVRRSEVPCLLVPPGDPVLDRVLVALDGTVRGFAVLSGAMDLVRGIGGTVGVVSVDTATDDEGSDLPTGRTQRLVDGVKQLMASRDLGRGTWNSDGGRGEPAIRIPRGQVVEEVLREVAQTGTNILVVGYRRGGPAAVIEAGSIARRLVHEAPCAILTIPL